MQVTMNRRVARELLRYLLIRMHALARDPETGKPPTVTEIAKKLGIPQAMYSQWHAGTRRPNEEQLARLLVELDAEDRQEFMGKLCEIAWSKKPGVEYPVHLPTEIELYLALEQAAHSIVIYDPDLIHGLFQTEDYARALMEYAATYIQGIDVEKFLPMRLGRQQLLETDDRPAITVYIPERVLRTIVGSVDVTVAQLQHLLRVVADGKAEIRVIPSGPVTIPPQRAGEIPFTTHVPPPGLGNIILLRYTDKWQVGYTETMASAHYYDQPADMERIGTELAQFHRVALSTTKSADLIRTITEELIRTQ